MAADGNWKITMKTPMGERDATLSLKTDGGKLTGTQSGDAGTTEIFDGTVNGDDVAWKISIVNPMALTLDEIHRLRVRLQSESERFRLLVELLLETALRVSEALNARFERSRLIQEIRTALS